MARRNRTTEPLDGYGHLIAKDDTVVFSWSGDLHKGIVFSVRPVMIRKHIIRQQMEVIPLDATGNKIDHIVKVKDTRSTIKL
jgi:hypothetical protein